MNTGTNRLKIVSVELIAGFLFKFRLQWKVFICPLLGFLKNWWVHWISVKQLIRDVSSMQKTDFYWSLAYFNPIPQILIHFEILLGDVNIQYFWLAPILLKLYLFKFY